MLKYVLKRLLFVIPTVLGVVIIIFTIMSLTPGSPGRLILGSSATPEAVEMMNERIGYNKPFLIRLGNYIVDLLHGDFGISYRTNQPVLPDMLTRVPFTLKLGVLSIFFSAIIGISIGTLSAVRQYSVVDTLSTTTAIFFSSMPIFWLSMLLMTLFSLKLGWLPSNGADTWKHYVMPVAVISLATSAGILRLTRTTMLETIRQDYIRTARAKGCSERTVIWKHAFKNAALPVITSLGLRFGYVLGGSVIVESVFGLPGIGYYLLRSIHQKDIPAVLSSTVVIATFFCLIMVLVDIVYAFADPRIRERFSS